MMTRFSRQILIRAAAMAVFLHVFATGIMARHDDLDYTEEKPLVIVSDWNFAPYEYSNDKGEPEGYHIDVLKTILHQLDIPFIFTQKEWSLAVKTFDDGKADMIIECLHDRKIMSSRAYHSRKTLTPYKVKIAYRKGTRPIKRLSELRDNDILMLKKYDYSSIVIVNRNDINKSQLEFSSPKESLHKLNNSKNRYFVWGEMPLQRMIKELNLTDIEIGDIDIPGGDMRFVSHDQKLIDKIDDQFARLEQAGTIHKMQMKWFHPEHRENNASPVVLIVIILSLIIVVAIFVANHFMASRIKKTTQFSLEKNKIMQEALNMSGNCVLRLNLVNPHVYNVHGNHLPPEGMNADEYLARIHPDDKESMQNYTRELVEGVNRREGQAYRWNAGTEENPEWRHLYNRSISERDDNGKVINIISTLTDVMADREQETKESEMTAKYSNIFEMSIVGLLLFNREGMLETANAKARELLKFKDVNDKLYYNKNLFDSAFFRETSLRDHIEEVHFCTHMVYTERNVDEYVEMRL
ncbi:MAG: transporter substrate-binding domain-containing protein, partial [Prevotella sp.]